MIFTLEHYNDLGKCSYATLMDSFDTELNEIYLNDKKVEITCIEDLFPFLWQNPGIMTHNGGSTTAHFYSAGTHWHHNFDDSVDECEKEIQKLQKKIIKNPGHKRIDHWMSQIKYESEHRTNLLKMMARLDKELEEQKQELIKENHKE